jgi:hypothetical protein
VHEALLNPLPHVLGGPRPALVSGRGPTISERAATVPQTAGRHVPKVGRDFHLLIGRGRTANKLLILISFSNRAMSIYIKCPPCDRPFFHRRFNERADKLTDAHVPETCFDC